MTHKYLRLLPSWTPQKPKVVRWHRVPGGYVSDEIVEHWPGDEGWELPSEDVVSQYQMSKAGLLEGGPKYWLWNHRRDGRVVQSHSGTWRAARATAQQHVDDAIKNGAKVTLRYTSEGFDWPQVTINPDQVIT
jgi:hypothetical protein